MGTSLNGRSAHAVTSWIVGRGGILATGTDPRSSRGWPEEVKPGMKVTVLTTTDMRNAGKVVAVARRFYVG
jgi:hypothetical protein